jgi:hypothetical protein
MYFAPQVFTTDFLTIDNLNGEQEDFLYHERQAIGDYPDKTYSILDRKPLTKYLEEASYIKKRLREDLNIWGNKKKRKDSTLIGWVCHMADRANSLERKVGYRGWHV